MRRRVSVVIPALNEAAHIERCVRSVLAQQVEGDLEVIVVDGHSVDGTAELAREAGAIVVGNSKPGIPASLNRGLDAANGEVVVRFDAHAEMPPGYIAACLRALDDERAASVGGWREDLLTNEDFDLDHRLRKAGGRIVFDPEIWSVYRPRESLRAIAGQYWRYGRWKAAMLVSSPDSLRPRQLAPPGLVATLALAAAPTPLARPARLALGAYAVMVGAATARSQAGWRVAPVLVTIHLTWGLGLVRGLAALARR